MVTGSTPLSSLASTSMAETVVAPKPTTAQAQAAPTTATADSSTTMERPSARALHATQLRANASPRVRQLAALAQRANGPASESTVTARDGGGRAMPAEVQAKMNHAFGTDFSSVRIHEGPQAPALGAHAYTQGTNIHMAPGMYQPHSRSGQELLGHELTHVVQQSQGRVRATRQAKEVAINDSPGLEREADRHGAAAARGQTVPGVTGDLGSEPAALAPIQRSGPAQAVVQRKLGFELELLVLVDVAGRPIPEKVPLGTAGPHLDLTVDQNGAVEADTPTPAETVGAFQLPLGGGRVANLDNFDLPAGVTMSAQLVERPHFEDNTGARTYYDTLAAAQAAHPAPNPGETVRDETVTNHADVAAARAVSAAANAAPLALSAPPLPAGLYIRPHQFTRGAGAPTANHPAGPGMGTDRYASILEIVTKAYEPETPAGAQDIHDAMVDAAALAGNINPNVRTQLSNVAGVNAASPNFFIGNNNAPNQSVNASIQTNLGVRIAQYAAMLESMQTQNQGLFKLKHSQDAAETVGQFLDDQLHRATQDAENVIEHIGRVKRRTLMPNKNIDLMSMQGFLTLVAQYLRLGRYGFENGRWVLDKNIVANLSRTDLSTIFAGLPSDDQTWLRQNRATVDARLLHETGRAAGSSLFTDPTEAQVRGGRLAATVQGFLDNVFTRASDGITPNFGAIRTMGPEVVRRGGLMGHGAKRGPIFEIRNMVPRAGGERFPPDSWVNLADYFIALLERLNARSKHVQGALTAGDLGIDDGLEAIDHDAVADFLEDNADEGALPPGFLEAARNLRPTRMNVRTDFFQV